MGFTGHPTTKTPNLDKLAYGGKILTTWYSGCSVCTGSRAALMTGRQFARTGLPPVMGATQRIGLNLNETTIAEHLKHQGGYSTGMIGKWHLGQRQAYLPASRGFDFWLGEIHTFIHSTCISFYQFKVLNSNGGLIHFRNTLF